MTRITPHHLLARRLCEIEQPNSFCQFRFHPDDYHECFEFATDCRTDYTDTHQSNAEAFWQKFYGKLGEYAAWRYALWICGWQCEGPDMTIYDVSQKSWRPDLKVFASKHTWNCHVKTQLSTVSKQVQGLSWLIQLDSLKGRKDERFFNPRQNDLFIGVEIANIEECDDIIAVPVPSYSPRYDIRDRVGVVPRAARVWGYTTVAAIHAQKALCEPRVAKFCGYKKAIYYDDLKAKGLLQIR